VFEVGHRRLCVELRVISPRLGDGLGLLGHGLDNGRRLLRHLGSSWHNIRNLDRALLELLGELLVQEEPNDQDGDERNNVKDVEWRFGSDLLDDSTLGMVHDWGTHY